MVARLSAIFLVVLCILPGTAPFSTFALAVVAYYETRSVSAPIVPSIASVACTVDSQPLKTTLRL